MGNLLNKEWIEQVDDEDDYDETRQPTEASIDAISSSSPLIDGSNSLNKRKPSRNALANKSSSENGDESDLKTPITNKTTKMIIADFDPRSPSADIVR